MEQGRMGAITVQPWTEATPPSEAAVRRRLAGESEQPYVWSNGPGTVYTAHTHAYHKILYVLAGTITFGFPELGTRQTLQPGDRLDLPPGVRHDAVVGAGGVTCLEAQRLARHG